MKEKLHALKKARLRQSWNKYNLYNIMRQQPLRIEGRSFFQQKYAAKQETRRYHGEHLTKRAWQNMFRHSLHSVVPMNARVLAGSDGSEQAAGRGAGLDPPPGTIAAHAADAEKRGMGMLRVPYMNQMWAPMERRLDMAVFRAMFASSARQARQYVVHGWVKVNGKKMIHPGYMLNPGDMFSVHPDRVLTSTGAPKAAPAVKRKKVVAEGEEGAEEGAEDAEAAAAAESSEGSAAEAEAAEEAAEAAEDKAAAEAAEAEADATDDGYIKPGKKPAKDDPLNPIDPLKPYATPWRPRDYLAPFAFIPRYLEVNFNICHAVYLRHPVARPGSSEVPSPFGHDTHQLAFHWFLRRR